MYNNALRPSTLFGIVLLLLAVTGTWMWSAALLDHHSEAPGLPSLIFLVVDLALGVMSLLFLLRVRWARIAASVVLHVFALGCVVLLLLAVVDDEETISAKLLGVGVSVLGMGACLIGILALHHRSMKADLSGAAESPEIIARRRSRIRRVLVVPLCVVLLGLAYGAWRIVPLAVGEPTVTVDYLAEANRLSRPADYDPNLDAAPHYDELFGEFVSLPDELGDSWSSWPADLPPVQFELLKVWASENEELLGSLRMAGRCPYWWYELESADGAMTNLQWPWRWNVSWETRGIALLAKYKAHLGQVDEGLQMLTDLHMLGIHWRRGITLEEQVSGMAICTMSGHAMLAIVDRCEVTPEGYRRLLDALAPRISQEQTLRFMPGERLCADDSIQRRFTDDGAGNGVLLPRPLFLGERENYLLQDSVSFPQAIWLSLNHPDRRETVRIYDRLMALVEKLSAQTPWDTFEEGHTYEEALSQSVGGCYFLKDSPFWMARTIETNWRDMTTQRALLTIPAVLVYRAENGQLPPTLDALADADLLTSMPIDPYSDGPLVYKVIDGDFTLYSVGEDCLDDGGIPGGWEEFGTDRVFWPLVEAVEE